MRHTHRKRTDRLPDMTENKPEELKCKNCGQTADKHFGLGQFCEDDWFCVDKFEPEEDLKE